MENVMDAEHVRKVLAVLRYHNQRRAESDPTYAGSSLEEDTLQAISYMRKQLKHITEE